VQRNGLKRSRRENVTAIHTFRQRSGLAASTANEQGCLVYYQPQVDDWKDFKELNFKGLVADENK